MIVLVSSSAFSFNLQPYVKLELLLDVIDKWISHSRGCDRDALAGG
jgi:hypothetical protein